MTETEEVPAALPGWYAAAVVALAVAAALGLVGRPFGLGVAVLGVALVAAAAKLSARRDAWSLACFALAGALAVVPFVRAAWWVGLPCMAGALALASLAGTGARGGRSVAAGLAAALRLGPRGTVAVLEPVRRADRGTALPALRGGLLAALLLAIFVPLLVSADAAFAEILDHAAPEVDLPVGRIAALAVVIAAGGGLALARRSREARPPLRTLARIEWQLPLGALVALFAAFVALQVTTLFAGDDHVLRTAGLTYAEYAREGFGQLIVAAGLTLGVIGAARRYADRPPRLLLTALCVLCLVILASALKRLGLYEEAFGFTRLRLLAHAHILWLAAVLVLALAAILAGRATWLPRTLVGISAVGALAFTALNPDGWIAERNIERGGDLDIAYLSRLSPDAAPALAGGAPLAAACMSPLDRDGVVGFNLARSQARQALARVPPPPRECPEPVDWG